MKTVFLVFSISVIAFLAGMIVWNETKTKSSPQVIPTKSETNQTTGAIILETPVPTETKTIVTEKRKEISMDVAPPMQIDSAKTYVAVLKTSKGDIQIKLFADKTPITVNNFVALSKLGFYFKTPFHRVINGFMIQGGDPKGDGSGGPGYEFNDEIFNGEYTRGTVAMANHGPNTNGSQFFIMHQDKPLPKNYVIFGTVLQGLDVVDIIATAPVGQSNGGELSKPIDPVYIENIAIVEK